MVLIKMGIQRKNYSPNIIFSAEACFEIGGFANTKKCRIWGEENHEKPLHP